MKNSKVSNSDYGLYVGDELYASSTSFNEIIHYALQLDNWDNITFTGVSDKEFKMFKGLVSNEL